MEINDLNNNKYFWAFCLILINLGARNIILDIGEFNTNILNNDVVKKFILFSLFFVGTKDILVALFMTLIFSIVVLGAFHKDSKFSLVRENKNPTSY